MWFTRIVKVRTGQLAIVETQQKQRHMLTSKNKLPRANIISSINSKGRQEMSQQYFMRYI